MKICHICTSAASHKILLDKLELLKHETDMDIHLISSKEGLKPSLIKESPLIFKYIDMNRKINIIQDLSSIIKLYKLLKTENYQIVHTHTAKAGLIGRVAAFFARTPLIIHTSHGLPFYKGQKKFVYQVYRILESIGAMFSDAILSQNKHDIVHLNKLIVRKPVFYEGNGINLEALSQLTVETDLTKRLQEAKPKRQIIFMGARFEGIKNHSFLIDCIHYVKANYHKEFLLVLAGEGPLKERIQEKVAALHLTDQVLFTGNINNIPRVLQLSDVVVLTSFKEGIPRILMEAMAYSKPIVATDVIGTNELVIDNYNGYLTPTDNVKFFGERLIKLLTDESIRTQFGENAFTRIKSEYTELIVVERIKEVYSTLSQEANRVLTPKGLVP
ncbi:glycosyltransferase family 4 protein [Aureibacillus halotolerans]|uniref:Glycosyltransferase involved in cell wall biosynthesis n=1 Tax=Aureibacillus halotolerans TaxID=1508390 RepID=A0A4R6TZ87_9BACI|nr:glycosyltransferase family 4 protein [Aureibacillus halotolerans]TDQ37653.1 glycosyltransferase involved in cell wall biosynthesis [Aureibacillus halotolerans]